MTRRLHVESWGDPARPRIVCLHGITGHGGGYRRLAHDWLGQYHVLAPDLLGHGDSPREPPWRISEHVRLLVDAVGDEPAHAWIGHSYGGRIAFEVAAARPDLVPRLVLLDPAFLIDPAIALHVAETSRADRSYASFQEGVDRRFTESVLHDADRERVVADLEGFLVEDDDGRWRYRYSRAAEVAAYGEMTTAQPPFSSVRIPTLLVRGKDSYVTYDHVIEEHRASLGDLLETVTVPGGHTLQWDAPDETGAAIAAFLNA